MNRIIKILISILLFLILSIKILALDFSGVGTTYATGEMMDKNNIEKSSETSLFNSQGRPVAYIDYKDSTIYLWDGKPVAYLYETHNGTSVYNFNGEHLGWFTSGILRDHDGNIVGFTKGSVTAYTEYEPLKSPKQLKSYKSYRAYEPYKPYLSNNWSNTELTIFLDK